MRKILQELAINSKGIEDPQVDLDSLWEIEHLPKVLRSHGVNLEPITIDEAREHSIRLSTMIGINPPIQTTLGGAYMHPRSGTHVIYAHYDVKERTIFVDPTRLSQSNVTSLVICHEITHAWIAEAFNFHLPLENFEPQKCIGALEEHGPVFVRAMCMISSMFYEVSESILIDSATAFGLAVASTDIVDLHRRMTSCRFDNQGDVLYSKALLDECWTRETEAFEVAGINHGRI